MFDRGSRDFVIYPADRGGTAARRDSRSGHRRSRVTDGGADDCANRGAHDRAKSDSGSRADRRSDEYCCRSSRAEWPSGDRE